MSNNYVDSLSEEALMHYKDKLEVEVVQQCLLVKVSVN